MRTNDTVVGGLRSAQADDDCGHRRCHRGDDQLRSFPNTPAGLSGVVGWLAGLDAVVERVGVEGSAGWGRHLAMALTRAGHDVREVNARRTAAQRRRTSIPLMAGRPELRQQPATVAATWPCPRPLTTLRT